MAEHERTGTVSLTDFWLRRARRLLPALFLMMFLLLTYSWIFKWDTLGKLRGDLLAGVFYGTNWYQIWIGQGYANAADFVPLRHLWSLAVEEQFYIVWPLLMFAILRRTGTRRLTRVAGVFVGIALAVTVATALLFHSGRIGECSVTPEAYWEIGGRCVEKSNALYLSTITRSSGLLLGATFAIVWRPVAIMRGPLRNAGRALDIVGVVGLLLLALLHWRLHFQTVEVTADGVGTFADPWLFRGGFLWTGIATLLVIAAVTHRRTLSGRVLGGRGLRWIGTRSYGLYLYHWPIYQIIRNVAGNTLSLPQFIVAMIITAVITEASYTLVETPIRRGEPRCEVAHVGAPSRSVVPADRAQRRVRRCRARGARCAVPEPRRPQAERGRTGGGRQRGLDHILRRHPRDARRDDAGGVGDDHPASGSGRRTAGRDDHHDHDDDHDDDDPSRGTGGLPGDR